MHPRGGSLSYLVHQQLMREVDDREHGTPG